jgi:uncharacterized protein (DUF58 family)
MLVVDVSGSGLFGSRGQSKRELAAEIASVLAFSAIRNNDKVGLILFSDEVEKFIPPRKGRGHVLRVIREVLFFEPKRRGTDLVKALEFMGEVLPHKAIAVVISDFLDVGQASRLSLTSLNRLSRTKQMETGATPVLPLSQPVQTALRIANRRHDVVAVQITDRFEVELPALGRLILEDAESGEIVELNTGSTSSRDAFALRQQKQIGELARQFRSSGIDSIQLRTDEPYSAALGRFFENREKRRLRG